MPKSKTRKKKTRNQQSHNERKQQVFKKVEISFEEYLDVMANHPEGALFDLYIEHDDDCPRLKGGTCNCAAQLIRIEQTIFPEK